MNFLRTLFITFVIILLAAGSAMATTNTSTKSGNWSDTTVWDQGHVPAADELVVISNTTGTGHTVVVDAGVAGRIPATAGNLASITGNGAGLITINASTQAMEIHCGTGNITPGTAGIGGFIVTSGATNAISIWGTLIGGPSTGIYFNSTSTLNFNGNVNGGTTTDSMNGIKNQTTGTVNVAGNVTGGSSTNFAYGLYNFAGGTINVTGGGTVSGGTGGFAHGVDAGGTGPVNITANVIGGSATAYGLYNVSTAAISITGNVTGGTTHFSYGIMNNSTGVITLNTCNLIDGSGCVAYAGFPPRWVNVDSYYHRKYAGAAGTTLTNFGPEPTAAQLKSGVQCGDVLGTYAPFMFGVSP